MSDIVETLRTFVRPDWARDMKKVRGVMGDAADEIESLRSRLAEYEKLLAQAGDAFTEGTAAVASLQARLAEAEAWIAAVKSCADDSWECPRCGHSEDWWHGSNADHLTRAPDSATACDFCRGRGMVNGIEPGSAAPCPKCAADQPPAVVKCEHGIVVMPGYICAKCFNAGKPWPGIADTTPPAQPTVTVKSS